jgi:hypothetical protein
MVQAWGFATLGLVTVGAGRAASAPAGPGRLRRGPGVGGGRLGQRDAVERPRLAAEVAVLPCATIDGDRVTVHNIRNLDYRTETDFTPAYYDRTFDLRRLGQNQFNGKMKKVTILAARNRPLTVG